MEYVAYHQESSHRVLPGDPIMDRLGEIATFVRATDSLPAGQPMVVVRRGHEADPTSLTRPDAFNLHLVPDTGALAESDTGVLAQSTSA